jgi:type IV pilus assembly protein PilW
MNFVTRKSTLPRVRGMSLIELMVALVISSIVVLGLVTLVNAIGIANRTQDGLARLQENGRFAMQRIAADLRMASAQHCSAFGVEGSREGSSSYVDPPRETFVYFNASAVAGNGPGMGPAPGVPHDIAPPPLPQKACNAGSCYTLSPRFMLMGHECDAGACTPALNAANRGINRLGAAIPAMGTGANQRGLGADVITVRYFSTVGALVVGQTPVGSGPPMDLQLENVAAVLAREGFSTMAANDPVWVSDCSNAVMFRGTRIGANTVRMAGNFNDAAMMQRVTPQAELVAGQGTDVEARAFHLPTSLRTVSYYLQLKNDPKQAGRLISALMRKVDADPAQELVEGVERFDLLYGVRNNEGETQYLTAAQVDALPGTQCAYSIGAEPGCGWRSVKTVEVYLLVNTVDDITPTGDDEFRYSWLNTGVANAAGTFENPVALGALRNGLPPGRMLRREFRSTVSLRVNNF